MRPSRVILVGLFVTSTVLGAPPLSVIHEGPDGSGHAGRLAFFDPETTELVGSVPVGVRPIASIFDTETGRLFVVNQGKWDVMSQRPSGSGMTLTVIDATTRERIAERPLPATPNAIVAAPGEGRLFVISSGRGDAPSVVTVFDRRTLEQVASVPLGPSLDAMRHAEQPAMVLSPSGGTVFVLRSAPPLLGIARNPLFGAAGRTSRNAPATLAILDAVSGSLRGQRELAPYLSQVLPSRDGKLLYVLCLGHDDRGIAKKTGAFGKLYVLDAETGAELAKIDTGFRQAGIGLDGNTGRVALLVRAPTTGSPYVAILDGASVVSKLDVPALLMIGAIPGSQEHVVLTEKEILRVDAPFGTILARSSLPFPPNQLVVSPDGSRAWITAQKGSEFASLALPAMNDWQTRVSGRAGVKFGQGLGSAALFIVTLGAAAAGGSSMTPGGYFYTPRASNPSIAFSPDGAYLFVYNQQTEDVTILETSTKSILDIVGVGDGKTTVLLPITHNRGVLAVWDGGSAVIELGADKKATRRALDGVGGSFSEYWDSPAARTGAECTITIVTSIPGVRDQSATLAIRDGRLWVPRTKGFDVVSLATGAIEKEIPLANPWGILFP